MVAADRCRLASPFDDRRKLQILRAEPQGQIDFDALAFTVGVVDHVEHSEAATATRPVMHENLGPNMIRHSLKIQFFLYVTLQPLSGPDPQVEFQLALDPIHELAF